MLAFAESDVQGGLLMSGMTLTPTTFQIFKSLVVFTDTQEESSSVSDGQKVCNLLTLPHPQFIHLFFTRAKTVTKTKTGWGK